MNETRVSCRASAKSCCAHANAGDEPFDVIEKRVGAAAYVHGGNAIIGFDLSHKRQFPIRRSASLPGILSAMQPTDEARKYLSEALAERGVHLKTASLAVGRNHAYLFQFINQGKPDHLPEQIREELVRLYGIDGDRLRPPRPAPRVAPSSPPGFSEPSLTPFKIEITPDELRGNLDLVAAELETMLKEEGITLGPRRFTSMVADIAAEASRIGGPNPERYASAVGIIISERRSMLQKQLGKA